MHFLSSTCAGVNLNTQTHSNAHPIKHAKATVCVVKTEMPHLFVQTEDLCCPLNNSVVNTRHSHSHQRGVHR